MNDEVENYNNEEFIEILTALGSNTKILINGSADFEIRHSWNNGEPYINIVTKEKDRQSWQLNNGQSLNTDLIICVCILTHRKENVKCLDMQTQTEK